MIVHARLKNSYGLSTLNRRRAIISPTLRPSLLFPLLPLAPNALSLDSDITLPTLSMSPRPDGDVCLVEILAESLN